MRFPLHARSRAGAALTVLATASSGCASAGRLGEYDFRGHTLGVVTVAPAHPQVFTGRDFWHRDRSLAEVFVRVASEIARQAEAEHARERLDSAVAEVNVAERMSARVLDQGARQLRARPVHNARDADFEIELRIRRYGIDAKSWDDQVRFMIDADVFILDGETGRQIWEADVHERQQVTSGMLGWVLPDAVGGAITAGQLASLSVADMKRALESLADYCADRMMDRLRRGLDKARA